MRLSVNGDSVEIVDGAGIKDVIELLGAGEARVAIMVNGSVVPRGSWAEVKLADGDTVEVIGFAGGG
jgi:thiamine biosynthesis protein ThiS